MYRLTSNCCKKHKASVFKEARQWSVVCATQPEVNNNYDIKQNFTRILGDICVIPSDLFGEGSWSLVSVTLIITTAPRQNHAIVRFVVLVSGSL